MAGLSVLLEEMSLDRAPRLKNKKVWDMFLSVGWRCWIRYSSVRLAMAASIYYLIENQACFMMYKHVFISFDENCNTVCTTISDVIIFSLHIFP